MGNKNEKPASQNKEAVTNPRNDNDEDTADTRTEEADMFIELRIFRQFPQGTIQEHFLTANPMRRVALFKEDLSNIFNIPAQNIQIFRYPNPQTEMPNNSTLIELNVRNEQQLLLRDCRETY